MLLKLFFYDLVHTESFFRSHLSTALSHVFGERLNPTSGECALLILFTLFAICASCYANCFYERNTRKKSNICRIFFPGEVLSL